MKPITLSALAAVVTMVLPSCSSAKELRQSDLDAISDKCHLDRSAMQLEAKDTLRFQPSPDSKYEAIDCVLKELKEGKFSNMKMGFVGNESYTNETK